MNPTASFTRTSAALRSRALMNIHSIGSSFCSRAILMLLLGLVRGGFAEYLNLGDEQLSDGSSSWGDSFGPLDHPQASSARVLVVAVEQCDCHGTRCSPGHRRCRVSSRWPLS